MQTLVIWKIIFLNISFSDMYTTLGATLWYFHILSIFFKVYEAKQSTYIFIRSTCNDVH